MFHFSTMCEPDIVWDYYVLVLHYADLIGRRTNISGERCV